MDFKSRQESAPNVYRRRWSSVLLRPDLVASPGVRPRWSNMSCGRKLLPIQPITSWAGVYRRGEGPMDVKCWLCQQVILPHDTRWAVGYGMGPGDCERPARLNPDEDVPP